MNELGQCLLFYLRYPVEMERLYEADEPDLGGIANADEVLKQTVLVGDTGNRQAANFLEACASEMQSTFATICSLERVRNNMADTWELRFRIPPNAARRQRFEVGVSLSVRNHAVVPWVWCAGNRRSEEDVIRVLKRGIRATSLEPDWYSGTVILDHIPIPRHESLTTPVPYAILLPRVASAFSSITPQQIQELIAVAKNEA